MQLYTSLAMQLAVSRPFIDIWTEHNWIEEEEEEEDTVADIEQKCPNWKISPSSFSIHLMEERKKNIF